jgi:predicted ATPase
MLPSTPAADAVVGWLQRDPLVLPLDNFEHLLGAAAVLADLLDTCTRLQLLVTCQALLHLRAERVIHLSPLPLPGARAAELAAVAAQPAVALYCDRARAANESFRLDAVNVGSVASLCRELEGAGALCRIRAEALAPDRDGPGHGRFSTPLQDGRSAN